MSTVKTLLIAAVIISSPTLGVLATDSGEIWDSVMAKREYTHSTLVRFDENLSSELKEYAIFSNKRAAINLYSTYAKLSHKQRYLCAQPLFLLNCE